MWSKSRADKGKSQRTDLGVMTVMDKGMLWGVQPHVLLHGLSKEFMIYRGVCQFLPFSIWKWLWTHECSVGTIFPSRNAPLGSGGFVFLLAFHVGYGKMGWATGVLTYRLQDHNAPYFGCIGKECVLSRNLCFELDLQLNGFLGWSSLRGSGFLWSELDAWGINPTASHFSFLYWKGKFDSDFMLSLSSMELVTKSWSVGC
jgi:hypothetical protein